MIVRTHRLKGGWRTEPSYLLNDYAATRFLHAIGSPVAVRLIGADLEAGVQVTEDLGPGGSLDDLLGWSDRAAAREGLLAWARALGSLHAATMGRADEFYRLREGFGPVDPVACRLQLVERSIETAWTRVVEAAVEQGRAVVTDEVRTDVAELVETLRDPGPFLALSSGDPCPYNSRITSEGVRFFDFELAGFRHCLLDGAFLRMSFPSCYRRRRLPDDVRTAAEEAYRAALGPVDDEVYQRGLAAACGAWAIVYAVQPDPSHVSRVREVIADFGQVARATGRLGALSTWLMNRASA